ncbi:MAG: hypothetical protein HYY06_11175 [Deltaproteobacteria bacterium]|nr:hypothetical protein [Deltaproteobacteria bacterium]
MTRARTIASIAALLAFGLTGPSDAASLPVRAAAETGTGISGIALGAATGYLVSGLSSDCRTRAACRAIWATFGGALAMVAMPAGVCVVGRQLGSRGGCASGYLGLAIGLQLDALIVIAAHKTIDDPGDVPTVVWILGGAFALLAPLVGAVVGHELSS